MLTYKAERDAGLEEMIKANASISFIVQQIPLPQEDVEQIQSTKASLDNINLDIPNTEDLYYVQSVLVSTGKNKNDDVFLAEELWAARKTPVHKPTNLEHDETQIVGHMTSQWAVDSEGKIIADNSVIDELPKHFRLCNGGVIYRHWRDTEFRNKVEATIKAIEDGEKYVSMECLFKGFDYGLTDEDGNIEVVARNSETAFLTKHLRAYGGDGEFNNKKVSRILRNYIFSGKGYVDNPANPESIILKNSEYVKAKETLLIEDGVNLDNSLKENINMSDNILESQLKEAKATIDNLNKEVKDLGKQLADAGAQNWQEKISALEASLKALKDEVASEKERAEKAEESLACQCMKFDESESEKDKLKKELADLKAKIIVAKRINTLISGGLTKKLAEAKAEKFAYLSDEQFAEVSEALLATEKANSTESETDSLKDAQPAPASASIGAVEDEQEESIASSDEMREFLASTFSFVKKGAK